MVPNRGRAIPAAPSCFSVFPIDGSSWIGVVDEDVKENCFRGIKFRTNISRFTSAALG